MSSRTLTRASSGSASFPPPPRRSPCRSSSPASAHVSASVTDASAGAFTVLTLSVAARVRGLADHEDRDPGARVGVLGDADPQPALRPRGHHRTARRAGHRRPRQRDHRAHVDHRLHREHPAARRAARHLRAVLPGAGRRGRAARPSRRSRPARRARPPGPRSRRTARTRTSWRARRRRSRSCPRAVRATTATRPLTPATRRTTRTATSPRPPTPTRPATTTAPRPSAGPVSAPACSAWSPVGSPWPGRARPRDLAGATSTVAPDRPPGLVRWPPCWSRSRRAPRRRARPRRTPSSSAPIPRRAPSSRQRPASVTLTFNEPVRLTSQEVAVYDAEGDPVDRPPRRGGRRGHGDAARRGRPGRRDLRRVVERAVGRRPPHLGSPDVLRRRPSATVSAPPEPETSSQVVEVRARRRHGGLARRPAAGRRARDLPRAGPPRTRGRAPDRDAAAPPGDVRRRGGRRRRRPPGAGGGRLRPGARARPTSASAFDVGSVVNELVSAALVLLGLGMVVRGARTAPPTRADRAACCWRGALLALAGRRSSGTPAPSPRLRSWSRGTSST